MDQDVTWHAGRSQPRPLCIRWGPNLPPTKVTQPPIFGSCLFCGVVYWNWWWHPLCLAPFSHRSFQSQLPEHAPKLAQFRILKKFLGCPQPNAPNYGYGAPPRGRPNHSCVGRGRPTIASVTHVVGSFKYTRNNGYTSNYTTLHRPRSAYMKVVSEVRSDDKFVSLKLLISS